MQTAIERVARDEMDCPVNQIERVLDDDPVTDRIMLKFNSLSTETSLALVAYFKLEASNQEIARKVQRMFYEIEPILLNERPEQDKILAELRGMTAVLG